MATKRPKLPVQQLAILAVARFAEPLAMTSVYPYLPEMIASFGIEEKDVAKWAGATSAVFSLAQSATAVPWGRASDRFGRKPAIMTGLLCTMTLFIAWGLSTSLTMAIVVRGLQGACNGNVGIIRTMVAEMVQDRELQPKAFSIMPLVWSIGSVFGPAFGGLFAKPAQQLPGLFGDSYFFKKFPFALPNLLAGVVFLVSVSTAALFLKETLHSKRHSRDRGLILGQRIKEAFREGPFRRQQKLRRYSIQDAEASAPLLQADGASMGTKANGGRVGKSATPSMSAVFTRQTVINLTAYTFLALHSVAFDQVLPVFLNYPPEEHTPVNTSLPFFFSGGFGLNSGRIGTIFTLYGITCGAIQFMLFPPLCARYGVLNCFRACVLTFPVVYFVLPFTVLIEDVTWRYAALLAAMIVKAFAVIIGFPCSTILLTNSAASLSILGTLNGFATTFSALGRASGPALAGLAFSWGVRNNMIGAPWWILGLISAVGAVPVWMIVDGDGPTAASSDSSDAEDTDGTRVDEDEEAVVFEDDEDNCLPSAPSTSRRGNDHEERALLPKGAEGTCSSGYGTAR
ncbi:putative major facilitator superfamily transporter [Rosellinia necatrix]|uniref:Putative major facilitator superfamily transporter n=1 Tax=Rosellinia necatrix TaxID=77044 RepID=A0A1W2TBZ9_ROSNE|nr:putative major facilitator superfamily transporter [Rosellinia necatrix]